MRSLLTSRPTKNEPRARRRPGRPPSKVKKVTRSVRIPTEIDAFLAEYGQSRGLLIGDVITEAVLHLRAKSPVVLRNQARATASYS